MNSKEPVPPHIRMPASRNLLIVDDDRAQARLFEFLLSRSRVRTDVIIRRANSRLSSSLWRCNPYHEKPGPELIIFDMNMPGIDSCTVLHRIKNHTGLRSIPVVMFSLGDTDSEIGQCYSERVNAYT